MHYIKTLKEIHNETNDIGSDLYSLIEKLYPICRSITGEGVRRTLSILQEYIPIQIHEVATGTKVFDWEVPKEWNIKDAYIKDSSGTRIVDFRKSNLHVVNYSTPVKKKLELEELKKHLFTLPDYPDWIPYRTSYYNETWGFCVPHSLVESLNDDTYEVNIDSSLSGGHLTYGELYIPGSTNDEVLFSCHVCHPSLCNDNLSGISVLTYLAGKLREVSLRYSYRFLFIPATIGSITWLALNKDKTTKITHGLVAANLGDSGNLTYKRSRQGTAEIDRIAEIILRDSGQQYNIIDFFPYGYDERQYCSPGFNLPVGSIMRTPHGRYPEYHTSADNLEFVKSEFLADSYRKILNIVTALESNKTYKNTNPYCEPQLGKRGLYKHIGGNNAQVDQMSLLWMLNMSDGNHSLLDIAEKSGNSFFQLNDATELLVDHNLLDEIDQ